MWHVFSSEAASFFNGCFCGSCPTATSTLDLLHFVARSLMLSVAILLNFALSLSTGCRCLATTVVVQQTAAVETKAAEIGMVIIIAPVLVVSTL